MAKQNKKKVSCESNKNIKGCMPPRLLKSFVGLLGILCLLLSIWIIALTFDINLVKYELKTYIEMNEQLKTENKRLIEIRKVEHVNTKKLLSTLKDKLGIIDSKLKNYGNASKLYNNEQLDSVRKRKINAP